MLACWSHTMKTRMIPTEVSSIRHLLLSLLTWSGGWGYNWLLGSLRKQVQNVISMFIIHWKGQSPTEATWEQYEDLWQFKDKIRDFIQQQYATIITTSSEGECDDPLCHCHTQFYSFLSSRFLIIKSDWKKVFRKKIHIQTQSYHLAWTWCAKSLLRYFPFQNYLNLKKYWFVNRDLCLGILLIEEKMLDIPRDIDLATKE